MFAVALALQPNQRLIPPAVGRWWPVVAVAVAVSLGTVIGCRSASSTDLVEREMRNQEDQIYALQDYVSEYQQLLCEYRRENEALKRQMVTGQFRDDLPSPRRSDTRPPRRTSPTPPSQPPTPDEEVTPPTDVPPLEFNESDIPPVDTTSADDAADTTLEVAEYDSSDETPVETGVDNSGVVFAAFEQPEVAEKAEWAVEQVHVRGEVWPGDGAVGPRVLVNVHPLTASGYAAEVDGELSLMILDTDAEGREISLARWDFTPDEWRPMLAVAGDGAVLELPLQLPTEVPADRPLELWVRLVTGEGEKVLAHTPLELDRPGQFASPIATPTTTVERDDESVPAHTGPDPIRHAVVNESHPAGNSGGTLQQSDWQTARPGEIAQPVGSQAQSVSDWRTATQPIPAAPEPPIYPTPQPRGGMVVRGSPDPARYGESPTPAPDKPRPPKWSPDRPRNAGAATAARDDATGSPSIDHILPPPRPVWSPSR